MDQTVLLWILGGSFALNGIQFSLWWTHAKECRDYRARISAMENQLKTVTHELGDHETGVRGSLHRLKNEISPMYIDWMREKGKQ